MFDNLRQDASSSPYFSEEEPDPEALARARRRNFLGMSPAQRFVIALLLFMMVCTLGSFCLLVFEKVSLPF